MNHISQLLRQLETIENDMPVLDKIFNDQFTEFDYACQEGANTLKRFSGLYPDEAENAEKEITKWLKNMKVKLA